MEWNGAGAAFFCLEPEPTQFGRSRSQLWDLGHPETEPHKKVAAPRHWRSRHFFRRRQLRKSKVLEPATGGSDSGSRH